MCLICFSSQLPEAKRRYWRFSSSERRLQDAATKKKVPGACGVWSGVEKYSQGKKLDRPLFLVLVLPLARGFPGPRPRSCLR